MGFDRRRPSELQGIAIWTNCVIEKHFAKKTDTAIYDNCMLIAKALAYIIMMPAIVVDIS